MTCSRPAVDGRKRLYVYQEEFGQLLKNNSIMRRVELLNAKLSRTRKSQSKENLRIEIMKMLDKYFLGFICVKINRYYRVKKKGFVCKYMWRHLVRILQIVGGVKTHDGPATNTYIKTGVPWVV